LVGEEGDGDDKLEYEHDEVKMKEELEAMMAKSTSCFEFAEKRSEKGPVFA
jgi:hypothetical protein